MNFRVEVDGGPFCFIHAPTLPPLTPKRQDVEIPGLPLILLTLPLSGRQGACGGTADSGWRPVHSVSLFGALMNIARHH